MLLCFRRLFLSGALLIVCSTFSMSASAQETTVEGVARSASLFSALVSQCQKSYFVDVTKVKKVERTYVSVGIKAFGEKKFEALLAKEMKRRLAEVKAAGAAQWCASQKSRIQKTGGGELFEKPISKLNVTADEMAMAIASLAIAQKHCGLQIADVPLKPLFDKRGLDLQAFLPDGAYASVIEIKMKKAEEFIEQLGFEKACEGINGTVRMYLPELVLIGVAR